MTALVVIHNAAAGSADEEAVGTAVKALRTIGTEVAVEAVGDPEDVAAVLDRFPGHRPVVLGGDGSLHVVLATLRQRGELAGRLVGLIPLGTGNDFARTLGIPLDPAEAAAVVLHGRPRALDLLVDDQDRIVVNAAHLGVGAEAARQATPFKSVLGRFAYQVGGVLAGVRERGWRLRVTVDRTTIADGGRRVLQVGVGNGTSVGGGTLLAPDAEPGDGLADVIVSFSTGPAARLGYALRLRWGRHTTCDDVVSVRGRRITVAGEPLAVNADGELWEPEPVHAWTVEPGAWRITAPA